MTRLMKDSGIEWIGQIPERWKYIKLKYIYDIKKAKLPTAFYDDSSLIPYMSMDYIRGVDITPLYAKDGDFCKKNDVLVLWDGSNAGEIIIEHPEGYAPSTTAILSPKKKFNEKFAKYYLKFLETQLRKNRTGMGIPHVDGEFLKNAVVVLPLDNVQEKIASFLDEKIGEIDAIISKTKVSIEEYKKYKNAVIAETITKGLDKTVSMKESGIEWVGKIPSHWEIHTLSQVFMQLKNKNSDLSETNLLSLSYGKIKRKDINSSDGLLPESFDGYNIIDKNDIVLRLTDLQNDHKSLRVGHVKERGIITSAYVTLRCKEDIATDYYYYFLHTFDIFKGFYGMGAGVRQGLNYEGIRSMKILSPDIKEQQEIVEYLNVKCAEIDALIAKKEAFVEEMEAYKKSLIYEYVTGKKEVL